MASSNGEIPPAALVPTARNVHVQTCLSHLRAANEEVATLHIRYYSGQDITEIVEELNKNKRVQMLRMEFEGSERSLASITPILNVLKTRTILHTIVLLGSPVRMTDLLLSAAVLNPGIQTIVFYGRTVLSVQGLTSFLETTKTLTAIYILLGFLHETKEFPLEALEEAFRTNTSLEVVTIRNLEHEFVLSQIMRGLAGHCKIRELNLGDDGFASWIATNAIRFFMERSKTVKKITFF